MGEAALDGDETALRREKSAAEREELSRNPHGALLVKAVSLIRAVFSLHMQFSLSSRGWEIRLLLASLFQI